MAKAIRALPRNEVMALPLIPILSYIRVNTTWLLLR